jgi:RNA polymerase sigma-70 factor (ECF subfamily)
VRDSGEQLTQHLDALYRAAWALTGSPHDAQDLVQETYTRIFAKPRTIAAGAELGYLLTALRNTFFSGQRHRSRRPQEPLAPEDLAALARASGTDPALHLEAQEIYRAIAELPDEFRLAITAVDVLGLSYREAADALESVEATLATRVHRARRRVADALSPPDADSAASPPAGSADAAAPAGGKKILADASKSSRPSPI